VDEDFNSLLNSEVPTEKAEKLLELNANSALGKLAKGAQKWRRNEVREAKMILESVESSNFYGKFVLIKCLIELKDHSALELAVENALTLLESKVISGLINQSTIDFN